MPEFICMGMDLLSSILIVEALRPAVNKWKSKEWLGSGLQTCSVDRTWAALAEDQCLIPSIHREAHRFPGKPIPLPASSGTT